MRRGLAAVLVLGLAMALSPEEVWKALEAHGKVQGYLPRPARAPWCTR